MPAFDNELADAVVAQLDAVKASFPIAGASVAKRFLPYYDTADLKTPKIAVAPRTHSRSSDGSRRKSRREYVVQVAPHLIASHLEGEVDESKTALFVDLVAAIADALESTSPIAGASWIGSTTEPLYDPDQLQSGTLRAVLTVTYRNFAAPA